MEQYQWNEAYLTSQLDDIQAQNRMHREQTNLFLNGLTLELKDIQSRLLALIVIIVVLGIGGLAQNYVVGHRLTGIENRLDQVSEREVRDVEWKILFGLIEKRSRKVK